MPTTDPDGASTEDIGPLVIDLGAAASGSGGVIWSMPHGGDLDANLVHLDPGASIGSHVNDDVDVLIYVQSGAADLVVDEQVRRLGANHLALIPNGSRRSIVAGDSGIAYLSIHRRRSPLGIDRRADRPRLTTEAPLDDASLAQLVQELADAVILCDPDGVIVYWNDAAERIFGWSAEQAIGESLDLIVPDKQRPAHWEGYRRVMATGVTRYGDDLLRVPSLHADGQRRSIAFTVTLVKDAAGAVTGIAAVVRDETQRWAEERELRRQARQGGGP